MGTQRHISYEDIKPSAAETANGNSTVEFKVDTARTAEIWIKVTAASGTNPTLDVNAETRLNEVTGWDVQKAFSQITAAGSYSIVINRADHAFGTELRVAWTVGGTTPNFTFVVFAVRYE